MAIPRSEFADQNLTLMAPIFTGGMFASLIRAARASLVAATGDAKMAASELEMRVRQAYLRTLASRELVAADASRLQATREMERVAREQFESGKGIQASVMRAAAESADAERALASSSSDAEKALIDLKAEMGVALDSQVDLSDSFTYTEPATDLDHAIQTAARERGDVLAADQRARQAEFQKGAVDADGTPKLYGVAMADLTQSRDLGSSVGSTIGLTLSLPIFDAGQRRADRQQADATVAKSRANVALAALNSEREVRFAWLDIETAAKNYAGAQAALQASQAAYDVVTLRVQNGKGTLVEQLDGLSALVRARANLAQALYDHQVALAKLDRAEGLTPPSFDLEENEVRK
jgi:outer membrane protein TolC